MKAVVKSFLIFTIALVFGVNMMIFIRRPINYPTSIRACAQRYDVPSALIAGIINVESHYKPNIVSSAGAVGLMQLMPNTAKYVATLNNIDSYDITDPYDNILLGSAYLAYLSRKFVDVATVLLAYNAGESTVRTWQKETKYYNNSQWLHIPYQESSDYLRKVMRAYSFYAQFYK